MPGMERTKEAFHFLICTNKVPKVRSKLRKPVSRQKRKEDPRRVVSDTHGKTKSSKHHITNADISIPITATPPYLPPVTVSPEFKEPEWSEYLWPSPPRSPPRRPERTPGPEHLPEPLPPSGIVPEFSHLAAVNDADRGGLFNPVSQQVLPRRRAKTPVLFIGQLESASIPRPRNALANERRFSATLLAEEYRALLDSPTSTIFPHTQSEPTHCRERLRRQKGSSSLRAQSQPAIPRRGTIAPRSHHAGHINGQCNNHTGLHTLIPCPPPSNFPPQLSLFPRVHPPPTTPNSHTSLQPEPSPRSSDAGSTLVAFDDEAIYSNPESASPRPPSFSFSISDYSVPTSSSSSTSTSTSTSTPTFTSACTSRSTSRSTPTSRSTSASTSTPTPSFPSTSSTSSTSTSRCTPTPPPIVQKDLSLQICLDLLTRDLSSHLMPGLRHRQNRNSTKGKEQKLSTETSALQVWVMIEGYEKLKEELVMQQEEGVKKYVEGEGKYEEGPQKVKDIKVVEAMLETWLSALYRIYDELSVEAFEGVRGENGEGSEGSESSYSGDYEDRGYGSE